MPVQSRRISLSALGIDQSPGLRFGNHLRIGFDPRMGFPPCGFDLLIRRHVTGPKHQIDFGLVYTQKIPAPLRRGYLQGHVSVFHRRNPLPVQGPSGGVALSGQTLCISFRQTPYAPDSDPKVCEVRLRVRSLGPIVVEAFDDRFDGAAFPKLRVARQQRPAVHAVSDVEIELRADLISLVEIHAPAGSELLLFEYTEINDSGFSGLIVPSEEPWKFFKEVPLLLPTPEPAAGNHSTYPTCTSLSFTPPAEQIEKELPLSRLSSGFVPGSGNGDVNGDYPDLATHLIVYLGPEPDRLRFKELSSILRSLEAVPPDQQLALEITNPGEEADESSTITPLPMVLTGAVDPHFARLVGLAVIDSNQQSANHVDYKVIAKWDGVAHSWITHDVFPGRDGLLNPPGEPAAAAFVDGTRPGAVKTNVELTWNAADAIARLDRANQHAGYHVFRRESALDKPLRLTESKDELSGLSTPDPLLLAEIQGDEPVPPPSSDQAHYVDRPPAYATYDYGAQAVDLFGRRSKIAWTNGVIVPVLIDPPPVSNLYAFYRDSGDPAQAELEARAQEILTATGQPGFTGRALLIEFRYPKASIEAIVGDVALFHVLYRHGRPNESRGILSTASIIPPVPNQSTAPVLADVDFSSVTPVPAGIDGFGGERSRGALQSQAEFFAVESATQLDTNLVRLRVRARRDYPPRADEATLTIGRGGPGVSPHPLFQSPRDPAAWTGFDLRHPQGTDDQGALTISGSSDVVLSLPAGLASEQVVVSRSVVPPENAVPGESTAPVDWLYCILVKNVDLPLPEGLSEYPGSVTVQVESGAGRRSELTAPAYVQIRQYGAPPPLTELASSEFITATRPDFEGRIGVWLTWPKVAGAQQFKVHRTEVPKLLNIRNADPQLAENLLESDSNRAQVKLLGGQLESIEAFTLVTPVPIMPEADSHDSTRHSWVDRVSAPRGQNYVYRIQPISAVGDESPWPPDAGSDNEIRDRAILVLQKNRDLLLTPAIYELEPLDRGIGVVVRQPLSTTITGIRIFKTDRQSDADDVRRMTTIHGTLPFQHPRVESLPAQDEKPARLRFVDERVRDGIAYFYRILFVDIHGNFSQASEPMGATPRFLTPPTPPVLAALRTAVDTVQLSWTASHNLGQVKLQRKHSGSSQWADVSSTWLSPTDSAVDNDAEGAVAHRLLLRDSKGRFIYSALLVTEA